MLERERGGQRFSPGFGGAVDVARPRDHVGMRLRAARIADHRIDAAGEDHPASAALGRGRVDVVGGLDVAVQQRRVEVRRGVRVGRQMQDGVRAGHRPTGRVHVRQITGLHLGRARIVNRPQVLKTEPPRRAVRGQMPPVVRANPPGGPGDEQERLLRLSRPARLMRRAHPFRPSLDTRPHSVAWCRCSRSPPIVRPSSPPTIAAVESCPRLGGGADASTGAPRRCTGKGTPYSQCASGHITADRVKVLSSSRSVSSMGSYP